MSVIPGCGPATETVTRKYFKLLRNGAWPPDALSSKFPASPWRPWEVALLRHFFRAWPRAGSP